MRFGIFKVTFIRVNHKTHKFRRIKQPIILNSLNIFSEIENILINIPGPIPWKNIKRQIDLCRLDKNYGFKTVKTDSEFLAGNLNVNLDINITPSFFNCSKYYEQITSVEVERSFYLYKFISSNR